MPAAYRIDPERAIVLSRAWGTLGDADITAHYTALAADPAFDPAYRQLVDLREVTAVDLSAAHIAEIAKRAVFRPGARRAYVAPTDVAFGVARMLEAYAESIGGDVEVFRDLPSAERWLDQAP
ncbi:hypothetical protein [Longimicrobium sp.]|uniref:hypothetical protein n=1 Tax=Longimicrobium sp. TaxID=2029185 RepID=UPI002E35ACA8|nr:hypothetical protein [Longimicrobium sp.]HEX6038565.1 hypothetical protein [Longimicrobium sp.]